MPKVLNTYRLRLLAGVVALVLTQGMAAAAAAFATRNLFSAIHLDASLSVFAMASLVVSGVIIGICRVLSRVRGERIGQAYALEIRRALFDQEAQMARHDVALRRTGYTSLRFVGDLTAIRNWPSLGLPRLVAAFVLLPATLLVLGALHLEFLIYTTPVLACGLGIILVGGLFLHRRHSLLRKERARLAADMAERMPIAPMLSALGRQGPEQRRIAKTSNKMIDAAVSRLRLSESLKAIPDAIAGLLALAVIWSGVQTQAGTATIAAGLAAIGIALSPIRDLATVWNHFSAFKVARDKCLASLSRPRRAVPTTGAILSTGPLDLSISELCAGPISQLSKDIKAGDNVRVTGQSGSGKSLLLTLISGLDRIESGTIRLAGHLTSDLKIESLRRSVALITARPPILKGSLRRALTMGLSERPEDAAIMAAATDFGLDTLVRDRGGLDAKLAEDGRDLSDGQKVRVALTRMALARPGLILVDVIADHLDARCHAAFAHHVRTTAATVLAIDPESRLGLDYTGHLSIG